MKKIIPILTLIGTSTLLFGCSKMEASTSNTNFKHNVETFCKQMQKYSDLNKNNSIKTKFANYKLTFSTPNDATLVNAENSTDEQNNNEISNLTTSENSAENSLNQNDSQAKTDDNQGIMLIENAPLTDSEIQQPETLEQPTEQPTEQETEQAVDPEFSYNEDADDVEENNIPTEESDDPISTLYSLSDSIEDGCDTFCELKQKLVNAIVETQNLMLKVNKKEIELTNEQKVLLAEQSNQLKSLSKQLSRATDELNFSLIDLNSLMNSDENDIDTVNLKYMIVLNNLMSGNEMLENGLHSLNLINNMFRMNGYIAPNNGRVLYGFQRKGEPPVIKDYTIDQNGNLVENNADDSKDDPKDDSSKVSNKTDNKKTNIDTYRTGTSNIDTFFNTALLDNEFMYGNNRYGMGGVNGMYGGYENGYAGTNGFLGANQSQQLNHTNGVNNYDNTQNMGDTKLKPNKNKKKKLTKNIDTYKDANTLTPKARIGNFKKGVNKFLGKIKNK